MALNHDKKSGISSNKLLKGLNDNELLEVCNIGINKDFKPGETLFAQGDSDPALYLILQGSIKLTQIIQGQEKDIATFQAGDGLGDTAFTKDSKRIVSAVVLQPSTLMVIDKLSVNMLPPGIQLCIYKNFNEMASKSIDSPIHRDTRLIDINKYLSSRIKNFIHSESSDYDQSELIHGILQNIPSLPMYTSNLVILLRDENISTPEVVEQVKLDPSLVGVILKTINSASYSLKFKISDVQHAITYLGFNQVYQLVVDHGVKSTMPDTPEFQELQCHSNVVSIISFELAKLCKINKPLMIGTIGLLHDIGNSVILLLKKQHKKLAMLIGLLDYARLGSLLLKKWNVPSTVFGSIEYQRFPEFFPPSEVPEDYRENVAMLHIAHLCYEHSKGKEKKELPLAFFNEYLKLLNFPEMSFTQLFNDQVMPAVYKKIDSYPENIRKFLTENRDNVICRESTR